MLTLTPGKNPGRWFAQGFDKYGSYHLLKPYSRDFCLTLHRLAHVPVCIKILFQFYDVEHVVGVVFVLLGGYWSVPYGFVNILREREHLGLASQHLMA